MRFGWNHFPIRFVFFESHRFCVRKFFSQERESESEKVHQEIHINDDSRDVTEMMLW